MRKTSTTMLIMATFFQFLFKLSNTPPLHDWQLKHRVPGSLFHSPQSGFVEVEFPVHTVGLSYVKPQSSAGLQQPDCTPSTHTKISSVTTNLKLGVSVTTNSNKINTQIVYLNGRQVFLVELLHGITGESLVEFTADLAVDQAALDSVPVFAAVHAILEPVGVIAEPVLLVASVGQDLTGAFVGDGEDEDGEDEEEDDEDEHDE